MSTTYSQAQSLNDLEIKQILITYLEGLCSLKDLQRRLKDNLRILFDNKIGPTREIQVLNMPEDIEIQVNSQHLAHMLKEYLNKKIVEKDISDWAAFVYMTPYYLAEGTTEEERWLNGEGVLWDVIQKLADPSSLSILNYEIAHNYQDLL
jgi:hypothetical protein